MVDINKIMTEKSIKELSDFEKMVAKWLTYDYYCPSIKAEVIWDMLLSEFIPDILACAVSQMKNATIPASPASSFYILAKEFPVKKKTDNDGELTEINNTEQSKDKLLSPKADYLVAYEGKNKTDEKKVIIVELKTTPDMEKKEQSDNYKECNNGKDKDKNIFDYYETIITKEVGPSLYDNTNRYYKTPLNWKNSDKYASQITYMHSQFNNYNKDEVDKNEVEKGNSSHVKRFHSAFINKLKEHYASDVEVYYLYVMREGETGKFSVRVKDYRAQEEAVIYRSGDGDEEICNVLKYNQEKNKEINKIKAWKRLKAIIDAVGNYNIDFDDKKKYFRESQ